MKSAYASIGLLPGARNTGSIGILLAPREWISSIADPNFSTGIISSVQFHAGKEWIELEGIPESYQFEEKPKTNKSGDYFEISARAIINQLTPEIQKKLNTYLYSEFVAVLKNKSGYLKLIGNQEQGMILKMDHDQTNTQRLSIELTIDQIDPAPYYQPNGPLPNQPTPQIFMVPEFQPEEGTIPLFKIPLRYGAVQSRLVQVKVAEKSWIAQSISSDQDEITSISLRPARQWINLQFVPNTYSFQEKKRESKSGHFFEVIMEGTFNYLSPESQQVLKTLQFAELIALVMDERRHIKVIGNSEHGALFKFAHDLPSNQETVRVSMLTERETLSPYFITDGAPVTEGFLATEDGEFIITEDGEFLIVE